MNYNEPELTFHFGLVKCSRLLHFQDAIPLPCDDTLLGTWRPPIHPTIRLLLGSCDIFYGLY